ncbi:MurR/RpiR family transcriptional regulator [Mariniluteicoccus endophyticus]
MVDGQKLQGQAGRAFEHLLMNPGMASHSPATDIARDAGVSVSTITRLAQRLGYDGWPALQGELRAHYIAHLSAVEVAAERGQRDTPLRDSLLKDVESTDELLRRVRDADLVRVARIIAAARSIHVTAEGSFAAVGHALSHNIQLAGYPCHGLLDRPAAIANATSCMADGDVLIVCSYWRLYRTAVAAAQQAHAHGATVIAMTDNLPPELAAAVDEVLIVPTEGTSFFPSLTPAMALQQGLVATLASLDPERTMTSIADMEAGWDAYALLHHSVRTRQT